jgi:hypothetical protein
MNPSSLHDQERRPCFRYLAKLWRHGEDPDMPFLILLPSKS